MFFNRIIIITDDGTSSLNSLIFKTGIKKKLSMPVILCETFNKISAKSNSISLNPFQIIRPNDSTFIFDAFPADCLLYFIMNEEYINSINKTLFIFGINDNNHFGYGNYVSSTTSLLLLAKHFDLHAISISSEIIFDENFSMTLIKEILLNDEEIRKKQYYAYNINNKNVDFFIAKKTKKPIDKYEQIKTSRGAYYLLSYNKQVENPEIGTDIYYEMKKQNYMVKVA